MASQLRNNDNHVPDNNKWFALSLSSTHRVDECRGEPIQVGEIRGWLRDIQDCNDQPDLGYQLEPDGKWLKDNNIDVNTLFTVGDVLSQGINADNTGDPFRMVTTPGIHMEVIGWSKIKSGPSPPSDWDFSRNCGRAGETVWPYDPHTPIKSLGV